MTPSGRTPFRDVRSADDIDRLYPAMTARIAYGELTYSERLHLNGEIWRLDRERRGGAFNGLEFFHFRFPEQAALMAAFLLRERFHRLVPGSTQAATPEEVDAEWQRRADARETVLAWARQTKMLSEIVLAYRFERHRGGYSRAAHEAAATVVAQHDASIADPLAYAGICIEWAEREHRDWFWRCAPRHPFL